MLLGINNIYSQTIKKGPYLIFPNANTEMTVLWQLSGTTSCTLSWGTTTSYGTDQAVTEYGSDHQFKHTITGLTTNTKYYYKVHFGSTDLTGSFKTAPASSATAVKFMAYGDTRTYYMNTNDVTARMLTEISNDADFQTFSLHTGDWVNKGQNASEDEWGTQFFNRNGTNNINFQSKMPLMGVKGNHENYTENYSPYEPASNFYKYFPYDLATTPSEPGDDMYYSFDYGPVHIVALNQYDNGSYSPATISTAQKTWLENDLANSDKPWKFILLHEPGWSASSTNKSEHTNNTDVQNNIQPLCVQYGVQAIFGGHNHYYAHALVNGVHHFTLGGGGAPLYAPSYTSGGVVQYAESTFHFAKIEVDGNNATITVVRPDGTTVETINLTIPVLNPTNLTATGVSTSQIDLSWTQNTNNDDILLAYNTSNTFGTPTGTYNVGDNISGGGEVIALGDIETYNHTGLSAQTYYYKIWSKNGTDYSDGITINASPIIGEPTNHVTNFLAVNPTSSSITLTWNDATGGILPSNYLIKAAVSGSSIIDPTDGFPENDALFVKNVAFGNETVTFTGLNTVTSYDFKIFPYTNSGSEINYKIDGTVPTATETTTDAPTECGHETFDNMPSGMYETVTWTGQNGTTWTATDARTDQTLNGDAICVRNGHVLSGTQSNGISSITISTQRAFGGGTGTVDVIIGSTNVGSVPYGDNVQTTTIDNINISGDITIELVPSADRVIIDDVIWECFGSSTTDFTTNVIEPTGGQVTGTTINYDETDCNNPVNIFKFDVTDDGATDENPTIITNIRLKPAASNTADWTDHIQNIKVYKGTTEIATSTPTITDNYIDIPIPASNLSIADNSTETMLFAICLNTNNIEDGAILSFFIDADNHGFVADASGSQFATSFLADVISNDFTITVICSAPTIQATDVTFSNTTGTATDVNWTSGNGINRIVIAKEGSAVDFVPVDNTTYTANNNFGDGNELGTGNFVVYNGNSNNVNITGLTENTNYFFKIYEYNCEVGNELYYTTGTPAEGNVTTEPLNIYDNNSTVKFYPNPTTGIINITIPNFDKSTYVKIISISGKIILQKYITSINTSIDLSNYSNGIYFIEITDNKTNIRKKMILNY